MKVSSFLSITVLSAVLTGIAVFSEEPDHIPRPTEKELEEAVMKFGRKDGIPAEIKGVWTTEKMPIDPDAKSLGYMIESFSFCEKYLVQRKAVIFRGNKPPRNYSKYSILIGYGKGREKNQPVIFITLKTVPLSVSGHNWLTYYPATRQMKFNHYIHDTLLYSRN